MDAAAHLKAVVVAAGELDPADASVLDGAGLVIAADGGALSLDGIGRRPHLVVGDLDSADPALVSRLAVDGIRIDSHPAEKDASDTELALRAALDAGATEIVLLGALGRDRLDHELANVLLLAGEEVEGVPVRLVRGPETIRLARPGATLALEGRAGDLVTLLALGGAASGITTDGLRWPLRGAVLAPGSSLGVSNEVTEAGASVRLEEGLLLVVERRRSEGGSA